MVTYGRQTAGALSFAPDGPFHYLVCDDTAARLFSPPCVSFPMGRPSWATPSQLTFLHNYIPQLPTAKAGTGQNVLYLQIAQDFLTRWDAELILSAEVPVEPVTSQATKPTTPQKTRPATPEELKVLSKTRLQNVRFISPTTPLFPPLTVSASASASGIRPTSRKRNTIMAVHKIHTQTDVLST